MQTLETKRKDIVDFFLKKGTLINNNTLEYFDSEDNLSEFCKLIKKKDHKNIVVFNQKITEILGLEDQNINWVELEKLSTIIGKNTTKHRYETSEPILENKKITPLEKINEEPGVKIIFSYNSKPKKREAKDFIQYFNKRFTFIENILKQRQELSNIISINRLQNKRDREQVSIIGIIKDKRYTKNDNCILTVEDQTGFINILVNKTKQDLFKISKEIVLDDIIGVVGVSGDNILFANSLLFPDIPMMEEQKKSDDEVYALFLSDIHIGSKNFLENDFQNFLRWINCDLGNETQKRIASKVKYIFIIGDLVDGCGVYPGQDKELEIMDVKDQYEICAKNLSKIPNKINLIICPGNHDATRLAEPQLPIYRDFAESLYNLPNVLMLSNPAVVNIHASKNFPGFNVLMYHGYSFDYYFAEVESIRIRGGYDRADLLMKFLLQRRHLAPSYTSTLYVPDTITDSLVIDKVPDFFVSGHIHKAAVADYRGVTLISGSCWQSKTAFQEKVGHNPEPSRVPIVNLQTRQIKILKFGK